jgi:hypothetical protein
MISIARMIGLMAVLLLGSFSAQAADYSANYSSWRQEATTTAPPVRELPFPRSTRTQAIWAEGACWKQCQISCTSGLNVCLQGNPDQAECVATADSCDRACQSSCRTYGGPLLQPIPQ